MANIATEGNLMKEEPTKVSHDSKFFVPITKSSFIDLFYFSNEDDLSFLNVVVFVFMNLQVNEKQPLWMEVLQLLYVVLLIC
jgi:hypothetical protein